MLRPVRFKIDGEVGSLRHGWEKSLVARLVFRNIFVRENACTYYSEKERLRNDFFICNLATVNHVVVPSVDRDGQLGHAVRVRHFGKSLEKSFHITLLHASLHTCVGM